ncbi:hypothetical protein SESBI_39623 [Sesbania bispinosa]|nr:hypothetical protein SESBI_39623 [Sesbania bispinosa]
MPWQFMHVNCSVVVGSEIETTPHATAVVLHARIELVIGSEIGIPRSTLIAWSNPRWYSAACTWTDRKANDAITQSHEVQRASKSLGTYIRQNGSNLLWHHLVFQDRKGAAVLVLQRHRHILLPGGLPSPRDSKQERDIWGKCYYSRG